jgi:hypothetical protein
LPDRYAEQLAQMIAAAGLTPQIVAPEEKQYVTVVARKPA